MKDIGSTVISQYANSATLLALITDFNTAIDPAVTIDAFYEQVWDIATAVGYGLDFWGRIVDIPRQLTIASGEVNFGFQDGLTPPDYAPLGQGVFWAGQPATQTYSLPDEAYRTLILAKAMANISRCSIPTLNTLLGRLFQGRGRCYVNDLGGMRMRWTFEFYLTPVEAAIVRSGALPRPTGVQMSTLQIQVPFTFGFAEAGASAAPFGQGTYQP